MRIGLGLLYGILVALIVVMGAWWVYFLTHEGQVHADYRRQMLDNERLHAAFLIQADPAVAADPQGRLGEAFPHLVFRHEADGLNVLIDPAVLVEIDDDVRRRRNMLLYEGFFFLLLLLAGASILIHAWRSETRFKQARELFLAGATHEFKTPLASLRLYTETLGRRELAPDDRDGILGRMLEDVGRLEILVDDVLALSADDTFSHGPRHDLDLADECRTVVDELKRFADDRGARLRLTTAPGAVIRGQRLVFALALRNLIINAIKHGGPSVAVDVVLEPGKRWHQVHVSDDGPGIPRRQHERVFECFYSGDGSIGTKGTGLGLYLVRRNVQNLGGRVDLVSEPDRGAKFTISLPAQDAGGPDRNRDMSKE